MTPCPPDLDPAIIVVDTTIKPSVWQERRSRRFQATFASTQTGYVIESAVVTGDETKYRRPS